MNRRSFLLGSVAAVPAALIGIPAPSAPAAAEPAMFPQAGTGTVAFKYDTGVDQVTTWKPNVQIRCYPLDECGVPIIERGAAFEGIAEIEWTEEGSQFGSSDEGGYRELPATGVGPITVLPVRSAA